MKMSHLIEVKLPTRNKATDVGKRMGNALYVHRNYESVLPQEELQRAKEMAGNFNYTLVKYNKANDNITFIQSPDWDTADEPIVGPALLVRTDGVVKDITPHGDPWIYHHKWLFVGDDYRGFDVNKSKERSAAWMSLPDIDYSRIGKKSFWEKFVLPRLQ